MKTDQQKRSHSDTVDKAYHQWMYDKSIFQKDNLLSAIKSICDDHNAKILNTPKP